VFEFTGDLAEVFINCIDQDTPDAEYLVCLVLWIDNCGMKTDCRVWAFNFDLYSGDVGFACINTHTSCAGFNKQIHGF
jgi:hypothetical protein